MKVRGVSFNLYVGNKAPRANLIRLVTLLRFPRFLVLNEAKTFDGTIPGYNVFRAPSRLSRSDDYKSTIFLVRKGTKVLEEEWSAVPDGDWQYEDREREARVYGRLLLELGNEKVWLYGLHRCPLGPNPPRPVNRRAWMAEHRFLTMWDRDSRRSIWAADWNTTERTDVKDEYSLKALASDLNATMHVLNIDGFLTRALRGVKVRKLQNSFGSDKHSPVVIDFEI